MLCPFLVSLLPQAPSCPPRIRRWTRRTILQLVQGPPLKTRNIRPWTSLQMNASDQSERGRDASDQSQRRRGDATILHLADEARNKIALLRTRTDSVSSSPGSVNNSAIAFSIVKLSSRLVFSHRLSHSVSQCHPASLLRRLLQRQSSQLVDRSIRHSIFPRSPQRPALLPAHV